MSHAPYQRQGRLYALDWTRLICLVGIFFAHSGVDMHPWLFWLCNELSPLVFVAMVGVTSELTTKSWAQTFAYAGYLTVIGFALSIITPNVITVLPTLAAVMVALLAVPNNAAAVIVTAIVAVAGSAASWAAGETLYTIDYRSISADPLGAVWAFFFSGAYPLSSYLFVAVASRWLFHFVRRIEGVPERNMLGWFLVLVTLPVGYFHVEASRIDSRYAFNPGIDSGYSLLEVMLSPQVHAGSALVLLYGVCAVVGVSAISAPRAPAAATASLTGYVLSVILYGVLDVGWMILVCLAVMEISGLLFGRGVIEQVFYFLARHSRVAGSAKDGAGDDALMCNSR